MVSAKHVLAVSACALLCMLCACSYSQSDHPDACKSSNDCDEGDTCFEQFCVPGGSNGGSGRGSAGSSSSASGVSGGTSGRSGNTGGASGKGAAGTNAGGAGTAATDADASLPDADAPFADAGPAGPTEVYASGCMDNTECTGAQQTCTKNPLAPTDPGFCTIPCDAQDKCPMPKDGTAVGTCSNSNGSKICTLYCSIASGCPSGLQCTGFMLCY